MNVRAAIAAALLAALSSGAHAQDCRLQQVASLDAERGPNGLLLVPVTTGDHHIEMLLDTGAVRGVIDADLAQQMGLEPLKMFQHQPIFVVPQAPFLDVTQFHSPTGFLVNGTQLDHFTKVPSLDIGASHSGRIVFLLARIDEPNTPLLKGILGANVLRNFDVEVDPQARKVNLFSPDHCAGKVVYWASDYSDLPVKVGLDGQIELTMTLDGQDVDTVLDTGASNTTLEWGFAQRVLGINSDSPGVSLVSGEGDTAIYRTRFKSLSAGGISINNPQITLAPDAMALLAQKEESSKTAYAERGTVRTPKLILGMDVLSRLHFYIAYGEQKLYFTGAVPGPATEPPAAH